MQVASIAEKINNPYLISYSIFLQWSCPSLNVLNVESMNGLARDDLLLPMNHSRLPSHTVYARLGFSFSDLMVDNNKSWCIFTICFGLFEETVTGRLKCYNSKYNIAGTSKVFFNF